MRPVAESAQKNETQNRTKAQKRAASVRPCQRRTVALSAISKGVPQKAARPGIQDHQLNRYSVSLWYRSPAFVKG